MFSGRYGDLGAAVAAILLHSEARGSQNVETQGSLREPIVKLIHFLRSMEFQDEAGYETVLVDLAEVIGQEPFQSPTVFNFYNADFQPASFPPAKVAPEFQIFTAPWAIGFTNGILALIDHGLSDCEGGFGPKAPSGGCAQGKLMLNESTTVNETLAELDLLL